MVSPASLALGQPPGGGVEVVPSVISLGSSWEFDVSTVQADPGTATFRLNNATQSNATALYISDLADSGVDLGVNLDQVEAGDHIYMQDRLDKTKFHLFSVTGPPIDNTSWHEIPIALVDSGNDFVGGDLVTQNFHLGAADSPELFQTVVSNDAELAAALTADGGDTFIKAGAYAIDLDALGALNTTARRFVGAGQQDVTITLTATAPDTLDFSAGLTDLIGVEWSNVTFRTLAAAVGPAILIGCFAVSNVTIDLNALGVIGFSGCRNLANCTVDINGAATGTGFSGCSRLTNCAVLNNSYVGFGTCTEMSGCTVKSIATLTAVVDQAAFLSCDRMSACQADYTATTSAPSSHHGFWTCEQLSACEFLGPTAAAIANLIGFTGCLQTAGCYALRGEIGFSGCQELSACKAEESDTNDFEGCSQLSACHSLTASSSGFSVCVRLSACRADSSGVIGYETCEDVSACIADGCIIGFDSCIQLAGCESINNGSHGYAGCDRVTGCRSNGNTGNGYVNCTYVSSSTSTGDAAQVSGTSTEAICPHTNNFQYITSPAALTADVNDYTAIAGASVARLSADALGPWDINGIAPDPAAAHVNRILRIVNVSANAFLLANQNVGSAAANRIITGTGADLTVPADGVVDLWYDVTTARWRVMQA